MDGAGGWQVFRRITLPLLLVATAPLMIASFAFNFNNFNNIYLLTGGGPSTDDQSVAGATDILISYTYKLAFSAGKGQQYSTAAAISIVIFLIVATISGDPLLEDEGAGDAAMTTAEQAEYAVGTAVAERKRRWRPRRGSDWWRHVVALVGIAFALFPIIYIVGAAFNEIPTLVGASANPIPDQRHAAQLQRDPLHAASPIRRSRPPTSAGGTSTRSSSPASPPSSAS